MTVRSAPAPSVALIYSRVSSDEQEIDGLSLPAQVSECRRYVSRNGWDFGDELQDVETGRRDDRLAYQRLLSTIRRLSAAGTPAVVVVASLDRLGRNVAERVRAYEELKRLGAPIHSVREGGIVSEFTYNILAAVAQEESRKLGERVRATNAYMKERGWHPVGRPPWGYRWRPATPEERGAGAPAKVLEPHPVEAPYVREAWDRLSQGEAIQSIARWAAGLSADARGGRNLRFTQIRMLLRAPVYIARQGRRELPLDDVLTRPPTRWEPLISDAVWQAAQHSLHLAAKMPRQASGAFPLTGLLRCPRCSARMHGRTNPAAPKRRRKYPSREYVCSGWAQGAARGGEDCSTVVMAGPVEAAVLTTVREILRPTSRPKFLELLRRGWAERDRQLSRDDDVQRLAALDRELAATRRRISALSVKFLDGEITRSTYDLTHADLAATLEAAEMERARLQAQAPPRSLPSIDLLVAKLGGWASSLAETALSDQRTTLGELVASAVPVRVARGRYEVRITWTPSGWVLHQAAMLIGPSPNLVTVEHIGQTKCSTLTRTPGGKRGHRRPPIL